MINTLKNLLGLKPGANLKQLIENGAVIVDVRTRGEYQGGHVPGSINIPLDQVTTISKKVKNKDQAIITCCASGMRSATAKGVLRSQGYTNVHNGGSWHSLT